MKNKKLIKTIALIFLILVVLGVISYFGISKDKMADTKYKKVLVIGIDGMDPKIVDNLMAEGKLPNLKKISTTGSYMKLNTSYPPHSPVAWTSIATGTNPGKHNIFDFIRRNPATYIPELSLTKTAGGISGTSYESYVKTDPFWRITTKKGIPSTIIRWPVTFPPEKVNGEMLSGLGVPDIRGFLSGYSFYTSKELNSKDKQSNKVVKVKAKNNLIEANISGPKTRKGNDIVDIKTPMKIELSKESANITVSNKIYSVKTREWSDWMRAKFNVGFMTDVYGTFKVYINSTEPFEMYVTTIQLDPQNPVSDISSPKSYSSDLADDIGLYYTLGMPEETDGYVDGKIDKDAFLAQLDDVESERDKMFWKEFENFKKEDKGVYAFVYDSSDRLQHTFWDEKVLKKGNFSTNTEIVDYYTNKDKFIGEVMKQIDNETLLLIVSDHGFTSFERAVSTNTWLVQNGFMSLTQNITKDDEGALFRYVDWNNTKAYAVGFNSLYINLKGREKYGTVVDKEKVVDEIVKKLENITDNGQRVVNKAYKNEEIYNGNYAKDGPDIIIGFNPGYRTSGQTAVGGFTVDVLNDNEKKWSGDHLVDPVFVPGVLFSNAKFNKTSASQLDIAPTIIDAMGIEVPKEMDGTSMLKGDKK